MSLPAVGYDNVDVALATRHGVAVCHTPGVLNAAVADLTMTMIFMLARRIPAFQAYAEGGGWAAGDPGPPLGHDVAGQTLGVIGFGRIGREVTRRMQALGMRAIWHDRFDHAPAGAPESEFRALDDLLRESDYVSIHTNLDESSRHLLGERELGLMRESAYLVNTARGPIVDQRALAAALRAGTIAGAALDVLEDEPPDADDPIVRSPQRDHPPAHRHFHRGDPPGHAGARGGEPAGGAGGKAAARLRESGGAFLSARFPRSTAATANPPAPAAHRRALALQIGKAQAVGADRDRAALARVRDGLSARAPGRSGPASPGVFP